MNKPLQIGFNTFDSHVLNRDPDVLLPLKNGVDYIFCHFNPDRRGFSSDIEMAAETAKIIKELGYSFVANFEFQNFDPATNQEGYEWANRPDGTHLLDINPAFLEALGSQENLLAVAYDEFEHVIINRNISLWLSSKGKLDLAAFPQLNTRDAFRQGEALQAQLKAYADHLKSIGAPAVAGEHVWPVLHHHFARAGVIPNFKSQKELVSNIHFAVAAGAALEYGTPLWNCVDLWHKMTFPGHTPEEMYHNLVFASLAGVDRVYVEASNAFVEDDGAGRKKLNAYGENFVRFTGEYKGKARGYNVQDYRPEIGIIRYDDTFWGQNLVWDRGLFGNKKIRPDARNREWLHIIKTITHDETFSTGFTWGRIAPSALTPHRSFVSMNALAVFDDRVKKETLESLKLCFLCGVRISPETLAAVDALVRENGLTVVCPKRYAPARYRSILTKNYTELACGSGYYIVTDDFSSSRLKNRIAPFLGNKGEIRLPFGETEVRLQIDKKGETFTQI